jgi:exosome complex RNA-binding protein Rrp42 (RNase PH superfamily)
LADKNISEKRKKMATTTSLPVSVAEVECLEPGLSYDHYIRRGVRQNGRRANAARPMSISLSPLDSIGTVGSAFAIIGSTRVLCTASLQVGTPDLATPNEGELGSYLV